MAEEKILVPDTGTDAGVEVIEICVSAGDQVQRDDPLVVVESDKATMEIPCPQAGKVAQVLVELGQSVLQGDALVMLVSEAEAEAEHEVVTENVPAPDASSTPKPSTEHTVARQADSDPTPEVPLTEAPGEIELSKSEGVVHAGPAVRKKARELGVDLSLVSGSGPRSRIQLNDLDIYLNAAVERYQGGDQGRLAASPLPDFSKFGAVTEAPMSKIQRVTAQNMQRSWSEVPHVTQFDEADISELERFRQSKKADYQQAGVQLTLLPFILKACAHALKALPQFNVALDMPRQVLIQKSYIHIAFAVDTPAGLLVPVLRDVDQKSVVTLAQECQQLAQKARDGKLSIQEMQGACFTVSSLGGIGGTAFTPIVNAPEVAILGVSRATLKPCYQGESLVPRLMLPLSLSYDHRVINGADGARFSNLLARYLSDIRELLL